MFFEKLSGISTTWGIVNTVEFRQWLEGLDQLDDAQRQVLDDVLQARNQAALPAPVVALKEEREAERRCPHCQTELATRHGKTA